MGAPDEKVLIESSSAAHPRRGALVIVEFVDHAAGESNDVIGVMAAMSGAALVLAGLIGWLVAGRILAPVREVRLAAQQIGETDLSRRIEVRGSDDVAALGRTFNTMLDRLEQAFAGQREFIDDAGHELRTPITIIRGHLELMGDDPEDNAATRRLVLDELRRMQRIVDDLLVPADMRSRIFERFKRGSNTNGDDGAGLGLPIVAAIAEAHGGRVLLDTVPGEGARFTIEIPAGEGGDR